MVMGHGKHMTDNKKTPDDAEELRPYASSPCYLHELDASFQPQPHADDWESVQRWRRQHRERLVEMRQSLGSDQRKLAATAIIQQIDKEPKFSASDVGFYWPLEGEVDLRPLMRAYSERGINVALPVVVEKNAPLEFWAWDEGTRMCTDRAWGIATPENRVLVSPSILFVPLLGFDRQSHRLGHGGGYYDRTLAEFSRKPLTVGVGYESGQLESIFPQDHDIPMDTIVTEKAVHWRNR